MLRDIRPPSNLPLLSVFGTLFSWSLIQSTTYAQTGVPACYFPNHETATGNFACNLSANASACCGLGGICLDSNLCGNGKNEILRGACTDETWSSPDCPQYCLDADTGGTDLISCQNVTGNALDYCCDHTDGCCDSGVGRFRIQGENKPVTTLGAEASTATRQSSTAMSSSSSESPPVATASVSTGFATPPDTAPVASITTKPQSSSRISSGAKAGIGIGIALAVLAITLISAFIWWRRRRQREATAQNQMHGGQSVVHEKSTSRSNTFTVQELPGESETELQAGSQAWELSAER